MKNRYPFTLHFDVTSCERCSGQRLKGQDCPECGKSPKSHEYQRDLQRRKRIVVRALTPSNPVGGEHPVDITATAERLLHECFAAMQKAARPLDPGDSLIDAMRDLEQFVADAAVLLPRPNRNAGREDHQEALRLKEYIHTFVRALAADTPLEAQRFQAEARRVVAAMRVPPPWVYKQAASCASDDFMRAMGAAQAELMGTPFLAPGALSPSPDSTRSTSALTASVALGFIDVWCSALDRERVLQLSESYRVAYSRGPAFLDDETVHRDVALAQTLMQLKVQELSRASDDEEFELGTVSVALELVILLRERLLKTLLLPLLAQERGGLDDQALAFSAGKVINLVSQANPELDLNSMPRHLRHAGAHQDFTVEGDWICSRNPPLRISGPDFVDSVLQVQELAASAMRGFYLALAGATIEFNPSVTLRRADIIDVLTYALGNEGAAAELVEIDDDHLFIVARGELPHWHSFVAGATAATTGRCETLRLELVEGGCTSTGTARLDLMRDFLGQSRDFENNDDALLRFLRAAANVRWDGVGLVTRDVWSGAALHMGEARDGDVPLDNLRRLRALRGVCIAAGDDPHAIDLVRDAIRGGHPLPPRA